MVEKLKKQPPVDRGKILISLECCRGPKCKQCPYFQEGCKMQAKDALAYIGWLEEQLAAEEKGPGRDEQ